MRDIFRTATNFKVSGQSGYRSSIGIAPSGKFAVTWHDYREGNYNIYAQRYNPDYTPNGTNSKVNNEFEGVNTSQYDPGVATNGDNIIFTWRDAKWQKGWDIAAKVLGWSSGIEDVKTEGKGFTILGISSPILRSKEWLTFSVDSPSEVDFDVSKLPSRSYFLAFKTKEGKAVKWVTVLL